MSSLDKMISSLLELCKIKDVIIIKQRREIGELKSTLHELEKKMKEMG
jgi:hypothetical protein